MSVVKNNVHDLRSGAALEPDALNNATHMEQQLADTGRLLELASKRLVEQQRQFEEVIQALQQQAERDGLTGLYNRRKFYTVCGNEILRRRRYQTPMSLIMVGLDCFKCVNDTHGHLAGDQVLVEVARLLTDRMRESDTLARWGGEEFMVLAPHTDLSQAMQLAEQLRGVMEGHRFTAVGQLTCCLGVAQQCENDTVDWLIHRADTALYHAKNTGRNRVEAFGAHLVAHDPRC